MPAKRPRANKKPSDEAVRAATGKAWAEWLKILDKAGAKKLSHQEIWKYLKEEQGVGPWWGQMIAVEYERARGMRDMHQKCSGEYAASASRTMNVPLATLYAAWIDESARRRWLGTAKMEISTQTLNKSLRAAWDGNKSRLGVNFYAKGPAKAQVAVDHMKLADSKDAERMKSYWSEALDRLQKELDA